MAAIAAPFPSTAVSPFKLVRWVSRAGLTPAQLKLAVWLVDHGYQGRFNDGIGAICKGLGLRDRSWVRELIRQISTKLCGGLQVLHFPGRANLYVFDQTQLLLFNQHANLKPRSQMAVKPDRPAASPRIENRNGFNGSRTRSGKPGFEELFDRAVEGIARFLPGHSERPNVGWIRRNVGGSPSGPDQPRSASGTSTFHQSAVPADTGGSSEDRTRKIDDSSPPLRL
jgi:hypothetical protein